MFTDRIKKFGPLPEDKRDSVKERIKA
jgi:hypothetical protein